MEGFTLECGEGPVALRGRGWHVCVGVCVCVRALKRMPSSMGEPRQWSLSGCVWERVFSWPQAFLCAGWGSGSDELGPSWKRVFEHDPPLLSMCRRGSVFKSRTPGCEWTHVCLCMRVMPTHSHMHVHVCACMSYVSMCVYMGECKRVHGDTHAYAGVCEEVRLCV